MSWPKAKLGEVGEFKAGFGFPNNFQGKIDGDFPFAKVGDISSVARRGEKFISTAGNYINADELSLIKAKTLPKGTIVFAKIGEAISQNFRAITACEMLIDNNAMGLVPNSKMVNLDYLYHFMCKLDLYRYAGATTVPALRKSTLEEIEIPLPPLAEQKRIAAILDKADAIRRKRQQAIQLADEFLRAVFLDMFGDPVTNPKGWQVVELAALVDPDDKLNYGVVQPGEHDPEGTPLVRSGDLSDSTPELDALRRVPASIDKKHRKSRLKGNEILIACVGSIGRVGWVTEEMKGWNIARAVTRIPVKEGVNREYLYRYLQNPVVQGYFDKETRAVAQPTLNVSLIAKTPIALPPKSLQQEFLKQHQRSNRLKHMYSCSLKKQESLFSSLSQKAFRGEL